MIGRIAAASILGFILLLTAASAAADGEADKVVLIVNTNRPASARIAAYYCDKRGVPEANVCRLECSTDREITREAYEETLRKPIKAFLEAREAEHPVCYLVTTMGIPLGIRHEGEKVRHFKENNACVDSELAMLRLKDYPVAGAPRNPYYNAAPGAPDLAFIYIVCRLDGPDEATVTGLIDKSLAGERYGINGRCYFDARGLTSGSYKLGDDWILGAARNCTDAGYECVVDSQDSLFSDGFPMESPAFYFGWYSDKPVGPFAQEGLQFQPGAVAYHLYSGAAYRLDERSWVAGFLKQGVTASFGAVYEPYLMGTIDVNVFTHRFLTGSNFGQACYMAVTFLSWQMTCVGDPLYAPFSEEHAAGQLTHLEEDGSPDAIWMYLRKINLLVKDEKPDEAAALCTERLAKNDDMRLLRALARIRTAQGRKEEVAALAAKMKDPSRPGTRLPVFIEIAGFYEQLGDQAAAMDTYHEALQELKGNPGLLEVYLDLIRTARSSGAEEILVKAYEGLSADFPESEWAEAAGGELWIRGLRPDCPRPVLNVVQSGSEAFAAAPAGSDFRDANKGEPVEPQTLVRCEYDKDELRILFVCRHPDVEKAKCETTRHDGAVWADESVELFLSPARDYQTYIQLMVNANGITADSKGHNANDWNPAWQAEVVKTAGGWQAQFRIPFKEIVDTPPKAGDVWGVNFGRNYHAPDGASTSSSWAGITGTFHAPSKFGYLKFE